ncbi:EAL domain-containing response regulator [Vibrio cholerae]
MTKSILIVDDQPIIRTMLASTLNALGRFDIHEAGNGAQAYDVVAGAHIDLIFCDINMPDSDGLYLLQKLSNERFRGDIVIISGEDDALIRSTRTLTESYHLRILGVSPKPITAAMIRHYLHRKPGCDVHDQPLESEPLTPQALAMHLDNKQVKAYFQPQYSLDTMQLMGFEALARIEPDENTLILPGRFISTAENSCLMMRLTLQVINASMHAFSQLGSAYDHLTLSLNVSSQVLEDEHFPQWLSDKAAEFRISNHRIVCELTETLISNDPQSVHVSLLRLRMLNFGVSIDDFGTGYATLTQLHSLPFNELKIDRSFVFDVLENEKSLAVCQRCIGLAQDFGLKVVAEGIEDNKTLQAIHRLGCDIGQGFGLARPEPSEQAIARVNRGQVGLWTEYGEQ